MRNSRNNSKKKKSQAQPRPGTTLGDFLTPVVKGALAEAAESPKSPKSDISESHSQDLTEVPPTLEQAAASDVASQGRLSPETADPSSSSEMGTDGTSNASSVEEEDPAAAFLSAKVTPCKERPSVAAVAVAGSGKELVYGEDVNHDDLAKMMNANPSVESSVLKSIALEDLEEVCAETAQENLARIQDGVFAEIEKKIYFTHVVDGAAVVENLAASPVADASVSVVGVPVVGTPAVEAAPFAAASVEDVSVEAVSTFVVNESVSFEVDVSAVLLSDAVAASMPAADESTVEKTAEEEDPPASPSASAADLSLPIEGASGSCKSPFESTHYYSIKGVLAISTTVIQRGEDSIPEATPSEQFSLMTVGAGSNAERFLQMIGRTDITIKNIDSIAPFIGEQLKNVQEILQQTQSERSELDHFLGVLIQLLSDVDTSLPPEVLQRTLPPDHIPLPAAPKSSFDECKAAVFGRLRQLFPSRQQTGAQPVVVDSSGMPNKEELTAIFLGGERALQNISAQLNTKLANPHFEIYRNQLAINMNSIKACWDELKKILLIALPSAEVSFEEWRKVTQRWKSKIHELNDKLKLLTALGDQPLILEKDWQAPQVDRVAKKEQMHKQCLVVLGQLSTIFSDELQFKVFGEWDTYLNPIAGYTVWKGKFAPITQFAMGTAQEKNPESDQMESWCVVHCSAEMEMTPETGVDIFRIPEVDDPLPPCKDVFKTAESDDPGAKKFHPQFCQTLTFDVYQKMGPDSQTPPEIRNIELKTSSPFLYLYQLAVTLYELSLPNLRPNPSDPKIPELALLFQQAGFANQAYEELVQRIRQECEAKLQAAHAACFAQAQKALASDGSSLDNAVLIGMFGKQDAIMRNSLFEVEFERKKLIDDYTNSLVDKLVPILLMRQRNPQQLPELPADHKKYPEARAMHEKMQEKMQQVLADRAERAAREAQIEAEKKAAAEAQEKAEQERLREKAEAHQLRHRQTREPRAFVTANLAFSKGRHRGERNARERVIEILNRQPLEEPELGNSVDALESSDAHDLSGMQPAVGLSSPSNFSASPPADIGSDGVVVLSPSDPSDPSGHAADVNQQPHAGNVASDDLAKQHLVGLRKWLQQFVKQRHLSEDSILQQNINWAGVIIQASLSGTIPGNKSAQYRDWLLTALRQIYCLLLLDDFQQEQAFIQSSHWNAGLSKQVRKTIEKALVPIQDMRDDVVGSAAADDSVESKRKFERHVVRHANVKGACIDELKSRVTAHLLAYQSKLRVRSSDRNKLIEQLINGPKAPRCRLRMLTSLSEEAELGEYKNSYILLIKPGESDDPNKSITPTQLWYINDGCHKVSVSINNLNLFADTLARIERSSSSDRLDLTATQEQDLITANGGFTRAPHVATSTTPCISNIKNDQPVGAAVDQLFLLLTSAHCASVVADLDANRRGWGIFPRDIHASNFRQSVDPARQFLLDCAQLHDPEQRKEMAGWVRESYFYNIWKIVSFSCCNHLQKNIARLQAGRSDEKMQHWQQFLQQILQKFHTASGPIPAAPPQDRRGSIWESWSSRIDYFAKIKDLLKSINDQYLQSLQDELQCGDPLADLSGPGNQLRAFLLQIKGTVFDELLRLKGGVANEHLIEIWRVEADTCHQQMELKAAQFMKNPRKRKLFIDAADKLSECYITQSESERIPQYVYGKTANLSFICGYPGPYVGSDKKVEQWNQVAEYNARRYLRKLYCELEQYTHPSWNTLPKPSTARIQIAKTLMQEIATLLATEKLVPEKMDALVNAIEKIVGVPGVVKKDINGKRLIQGIIRHNERSRLRDTLDVARTKLLQGIQGSCLAQPHANVRLLLENLFWKLDRYQKSFPRPSATSFQRATAIKGDIFDILHNDYLARYGENANSGLQSGGIDANKITAFRTAINVDKSFVSPGLQKLFADAIKALDKARIDDDNTGRVMIVPPVAAPAPASAVAGVGPVPVAVTPSVLPVAAAAGVVPVASAAALPPASPPSHRSSAVRTGDPGSHTDQGSALTGRAAMFPKNIGDAAAGVGRLLTIEEGEEADLSKVLPVAGAGVNF